MNNVEVDSSKVLSLFANLNTKKQNQVYKRALVDGARVLQKETKRTLRTKIGAAANHKNWWNGKALNAGIKVSPQKDIEKDGVKVHVMGDFRLRIFEIGTKQRHTTGSNNSKVKGKTPQYRQHKSHSTGTIHKINFFKDAQQHKEKEIFNKLDDFILKNINRIAKK